MTTAPRPTPPLRVELVTLLQLGSQIGIVATTYFPDGRAARFHTWISSLRVSYPYVRGRGLRLSAFAGPFRFDAAVNACLAFDRDQPGVGTSWSNITPLAFLGARKYAAGCIFVISRHALIDND